MKTIAERTIRGRTIRYVLKQDAAGFYFDGMANAAFRRKTRRGIEGWAAGRKFDVLETE